MVNVLGTMLAAGSGASASQDVVQHATDSAGAAVHASASTLHDLLKLPDHWPTTQDLVDCCQHMNAATGAILVIGGLIYIAFGIYMFKALMTLNVTIAGAVVGALLGEKAGGATI